MQRASMTVYSGEPRDGASRSPRAAHREATHPQTTMNSRKAVILLSGGLDSATTLAVAKHEAFRPYALTFRYGQRHAVEVDAARRIGIAMGVAEHRVIEIDLRQFGGSALTDAIDVPKGGAAASIGDAIPVTYVPARNTIFLAYALAWAEVLECGDIFLGVNAVDYSGYPDCRPEFIEAFARVANLGTRAGVRGTNAIRIHTPLIRRSKSDIIRLGRDLGVDFALTTSCYDPDRSGRACGRCDACVLRRRGFDELGWPDPASIRPDPDLVRAEERTEVGSEHPER